MEAHSLFRYWSTMYRNARPALSDLQRIYPLLLGVFRFEEMSTRPRSQGCISTIHPPRMGRDAYYSTSIVRKADQSQYAD